MVTKFRLKTRLISRGDNLFNIFGEGDPDLNVQDLIDITNKITEYQSENSNKKPINVFLYEESIERWWNKDWDLFDRSYPYGAPITRLPINSNSNELSLSDPISLVHSHLYKGLYGVHPEFKISIKDQR